MRSRLPGYVQARWAGRAFALAAGVFGVVAWQTHVTVLWLIVAVTVFVGFGFMGMSTLMRNELNLLAFRCEEQFPETQTHLPGCPGGE